MRWTSCPFAVEVCSSDVGFLFAAGRLGGALMAQEVSLEDAPAAAGSGEWKDTCFVCCDPFLSRHSIQFRNSFKCSSITSTRSFGQYFNCILKYTTFFNLITITNAETTH